MSQWKRGMCDCCQAIPACYLATFCGIPFLQGIAHFEMNGGRGGGTACLLSTLLGPCGAAINRQAVRNKYGISGNCCLECLLYTCGMGVCMATQEYQEVYLNTSNIAK
ncbi:unnamed protein product [Blepharisma stoltei]|uniref:Uncharacterized protein n=1 Tax=Blepharisma stoltei TaxID=1481888 RepID=A0AAU9IDL2_9CILI|nr:unnamed protein product [Blepharisma stoltei]